MSRDRSRGSSEGGLLTRRRLIGVLLLAGGGAVGLQGTGAFSSILSDRPFNLGTADDDSALLAFQSLDPTGQDGSDVELIRLTNQTENPITTISVNLASSSALITSIETPPSLGAGQSGVVTATLSCAEETSEEVDFVITTSGSGQSVQLQRSVNVTCAPPAAPIDITGVQWRDGGINPIEASEDTDITVDVVYYDGRGQPGKDEGAIAVACGVETSTNTNIRSDLPGQANTHLAVVINELEQSWYHPAFDPETGTVDRQEWTPNAEGQHTESDVVSAIDSISC